MHRRFLTDYKLISNFTIVNMYFSVSLCMSVYSLLVPCWIQYC